MGTECYFCCGSVTHVIKDLLAEALPEECWELVLDSTGGQFLDSTDGQCSVFTVASVNSAIAIAIAQPPC